MSELKTKVTEVHITSDGKEFLNKDEALSHQKALNGMKYYKVYYHPDLTETGRLMKEMYVSVKPYHNMGHDLMLEDYLYKKLGSRAAYVQGVSRTQNWAYTKIDVKDIPGDETFINITEANISNMKG